MKNNNSTLIVFSDPPSGSQVNFPVHVTLSSDVAGATIRYTVDGTDPDSLSTIHTGPILIESGVMLRAIAHREDGKEGPITSFQFNRKEP